MNLTNGGDQIWSAEYEIIRRLTTQATKQQDNSYRFEFNHNLLFGGPSGTRRTRTASQKFEIGYIRFEGGGPFSDKTLLNNFGSKPARNTISQKFKRAWTVCMISTCRKNAWKRTYACTGKLWKKPLT